MSEVSIHQPEVDADQNLILKAQRRVQYRRGPGSLLFDTLNHIFLVFVSVASLYPLLHVVAISLSDPSAISAGLVGIFPKGWNTSGYVVVFQQSDLWRSYGNTVMYAAVGTLFHLSLTSLIAYPLAVREFMFKKPITIALAITMFFSGGLIPTYLIIRDLGMLNTTLVMVLPWSIGAFQVFIFRTFFQRMPDDLRESAYMDGANDIRILFRIYLPLSRALLATFGLFHIVGHWNEWFRALVYLREDVRYPIQMLLRRMVLLHDYGEGFGENAMTELIEEQIVNPKNIQMAVIVIAMLPILCLYPFLQKHFAKGALIGSIKG
jgi:putative aldouronate transport system permease protein